MRFNGDWYVRPNSKNYSFTNNYCVFPVARNLFDLSQVYQHFDQNEIHNKLPADCVSYINFPLTVTHKHPASANTMRQLLVGSEEDVGILRNSVRAYLERCSSSVMPESLKWSSELVEESCFIFNLFVISFFSIWLVCSGDSSCGQCPTWDHRERAHAINGLAPTLCFR